MVLSETFTRFISAHAPSCIILAVPKGAVRFEAKGGLTAPKGWSYEETAAYGHFGRKAFPWERTDKVEALRAAVFPA